MAITKTMGQMCPLNCVFPLNIWFSLGCLWMAVRTAKDVIENSFGDHGWWMYRSMWLGGRERERERHWLSIWIISTVNWCKLLCCSSKFGRWGFRPFQMTNVFWQTCKIRLFPQNPSSFRSICTSDFWQKLKCTLRISPNALSGPAEDTTIWLTGHCCQTDPTSFHGDFEKHKKAHTQNWQRTTALSVGKFCDSLYI